MTDYKKLVDKYEQCTKQELVEKLTLKTAELLTCEKEVDRRRRAGGVPFLVNNRKPSKHGTWKRSEVQGRDVP